MHSKFSNPNGASFSIHSCNASVSVFVLDQSVCTYIFLLETGETSQDPIGCNLGTSSLGSVRVGRLLQ